MPDLIDVKVPDIGDFTDVPIIELHVSPGVSFPSRAFWESVRSSEPICTRPFWSTSRMTGTTRPWGVSAAKPRW